MDDDRDSRLCAALDDPSTQCAVVERIECDLDGRDRNHLHGLVQLAAVDIRKPYTPHDARVEQTRQRTDGRPPRRSRIGCMDEVEVDRESVQSSEACFAIGLYRSRATVGDPPTTGSRHAALRHDPSAALGAATT